MDILCLRTSSSLKSLDEVAASTIGFAKIVKGEVKVEMMLPSVLSGELKKRFKASRQVSLSGLSLCALSSIIDLI